LGSIPFALHEGYNIARGIIEKIGVGKIVHRDKMPPLPPDVIARTRIAAD
jgi:hypothetical protein